MYVGKNRGRNTVYCVIVGDIVNSRTIEAGAREEIFRAAKEVFDRINTDFVDSLMAGFGMVRGDAFEGVLLTHYQAPVIVQDIIKAFYRTGNTKVRISVALGRLTMTGSDRNEADGPAFYQAVDMLKRMKKRGSEHWLQVSFDTGSPAQPVVESLLELLSALTQNWTERQREIVWAMQELSHQQNLVAKKLGVKPPVINKQLKAASYEAYLGAWSALEAYLANMEELSVSEERPEPEKSYAAFLSVGKRKIDQRNSERALDLLRHARTLAEAELGYDDPQLAVVYNALADAQMDTGHFGDAELTLGRAVAVQENLPKNSLTYARTLIQQGNLCWRLKQLDNAQARYEQALAICRNTVGEIHPLANECYNNLAIVYEDDGRQRESLNYYFKALEILRKTGRDKTVDYYVTISNIALCYTNIDKAEAKKYALRALSGYESTLPPRHNYITGIKRLLSDLNAGEEETK